MIKILVITTGLIWLCVSGNAYSEVDEWQKMVLLDPPQSQLLAEAEGRVMIYDGMPIEAVNLAMDEQFNRIDNMMFTRIHHSTSNGEKVEDDGCD